MTEAGSFTQRSVMMTSDARMMSEPMTGLLATPAGVTAVTARLIYELRDPYVVSARINGPADARTWAIGRDQGLLTEARADPSRVTGFLPCG